MPRKFMIGREVGMKLVEAGVLPEHCRDARINLPMNEAVSIDCNVLVDASQWPTIARLLGPSEVKEVFLKDSFFRRLWQVITGRLNVGVRLLPRAVETIDVTQCADVAEQFARGYCPSASSASPR